MSSLWMPLLPWLHPRDQNMIPLVAEALGRPHPLEVTALGALAAEVPATATLRFFREPHYGLLFSPRPECTSGSRFARSPVAAGLGPGLGHGLESLRGRPRPSHRLGRLAEPAGGPPSRGLETPAGPGPRVMKFLWIVPQPFYTPRGTPMNIRRLLEVVASRGHQVDVVTYPIGEDVTLPPGVRVFRAARVPLIRRVPIGPSARKIPLDIVLWLRAARALRNCGAAGYGALHGFEEGGWIAAGLAASFGVPFVYDMDLQPRTASPRVAEPGVSLRGPVGRMDRPNGSRPGACYPHGLRNAERYRSR